MRNQAVAQPITTKHYLLAFGALNLEGEAAHESALALARSILEAGEHQPSSR